eukprot:15447-Eustigmatos_ZCMA.PRE.1
MLAGDAACVRRRGHPAADDAHRVWNGCSVRPPPCSCCGANSAKPFASDWASGSVKCALVRPSMSCLVTDKDPAPPPLRQAISPHKAVEGRANT